MSSVSLWVQAEGSSTDEVDGQQQGGAALEPLQTLSAALMRCFWTVTTGWSSCRNISISNRLYEACCQAAMSSRGRECQWQVMVFSGGALAPRVKLPLLDINNCFSPPFKGVMFSGFLSFNKYIFLKVSAFCILFMRLQPVTSVFNVSQRTNEKLLSVFKQI